MDTYDELHKPEAVYINDDERIKVLENLTDSEEIDAAIELIEEEMEASNKKKEKTSSSPETDETDKSQLENPDEQSKSKEGDAEESSEAIEEGKEKVEQVKDKEFTITDEFINSQPEEDRKILLNFKDKKKEDLAKATANAYSLSNPFLKDNKEAIDSMAKRIVDLPESELVKVFIEAQRGIGKTKLSDLTSVSQEKLGTEQVPAKEKKVKLPEISFENDEIKNIFDKGVVSKLKEKYPDIPDDINSPDFKEWERDLQDEKGIRGIESYLNDLRNAEDSVKEDLQKAIFIQTNLQNLYNQSPSELLGIVNENNLEQLKDLNDNFRKINNETLKSEVEGIRNELKKFGLTEKDLGIDLELKEDNNGALYNENIEKMFYDGNNIDANLINVIGKVPILKKGQLFKKFIFDNNYKILNLLVEGKVKKDKMEREKLKNESLEQIQSKPPVVNKPLTIEDITQMTDLNALDKIEQELSAKIK